MAEDSVAYLKRLKAQGVISTREEARLALQDWKAAQGSRLTPMPGAPRQPGPYRDDYEGNEPVRARTRPSPMETFASETMEAMTPGATKFAARTGDPRQDDGSWLSRLPISTPFNPLWLPQTKTGDEARAASDEGARQLEDSRQLNPKAALAGTVFGGMATPGARVSGAMGAGVRAANAGGRILSAGLAGAAGGATDATMRSMVGEGSGNAAADIGIGGLAGGVLGSLFQGGAETVVRGARAVANTVAGRAAQLVNRHADSLRGVEPTDQNIGRLAEEGATNILQGREARFQRDVMDPHIAAKAEIAAGRGGEIAPPDEVAAIYDEMSRLARSGKLMPGERATVAALIDDLVAGTSDDGTVLFRPKTHTEVNDLRGMYDRVAQVGAVGQGVGRAQMADVANAARDVVNEGPYAATNARFHEGADALETDRNLLGLAKKAKRNPSIETPEGLDQAEVERVGRHLRRQSINSSTSGINNGGGSDLDQFVARNPEFQRAAELPGALSAKGDLQFRWPGQAPAHGGLLGRIGQGSTGVGAAAYLLDQIPALTAHIDPSWGPIGIGLGTLAANIDPITGRILMPMANSAAGVARQVTPGMSGTAATALTSRLTPPSLGLGLGPSPFDERKPR